MKIVKRIFILFIAAFTTVNSFFAGCVAFADTDKSITSQAYNTYLEQNASSLNEKRFTKELTASDVAVDNGKKIYGFSFDANGGLYNIKLRYRYLSEANDDAEATFYINGNIPYSQLDGFFLKREYLYTGEFNKDIYGNDITPDCEQSLQESETFIFDADGMYNSCLAVALNDGENRIEIKTVDAVEISQVEFIPVSQLLSYDETLEAWEKQGLEVIETEDIILQAENNALVSASTIYPISDRSSADTIPNTPGKIRLNTIGGYRWQNTGDYIEWVFDDVPAEGLYYISFRLRQNTLPGQRSSRTVFVNGELQYREAYSVTVDYNDSWQIKTLGNEEESYCVHLKKGENRIRLQASLGAQDEILRNIESSLQVFNNIYLDLLAVMGSSPDMLRDYKLDETTPVQLEKLNEERKVITSLAKELEDFTEGSNSGIGLLNTFVRQLEKMCEDCDNIPSEFSYFKSNLGSLGTWLYEAKKQPLEIDYICISGEGKKNSDANASFWRQLLFGFKEFLCSFITDYQSIGQLETDDSESDVRIWIYSGRDQTQTIRNMITSSFTPDTGIKVDLELVSVSLLSATVAGNGPDAVILSSPDVYNFAMRNAAYDLTQFEDFETIKQRFAPELFIPVTYLSGVYGLPENIGFDVLFYRTDILEDLNIKVPETWDDLVYVSSLLAHKNMEVGFAASDGNYLTLVLQSGLPIYSEDQSRCLLNGKEYVEIFEKYTKFYSHYGFLQSYDFQNRFRTGEMPIGVADFSMFNTLQVAAPEIKNRWEMAMLPGTLKDDGTVDHSAISGGGSAMILRKAEHPNAAWEFLKWWTSEDIQSKFANEIESLLGESARYSSANSAAFEKSTWSAEYKAVLLEQRNQLVAVEPVPGGYYLSRHLTNAFRNVVYNSKRPLDVMYDYVEKINGEITKKRQEFGLE